VGSLIAVVNDETTFIEMVCELLEDEGYQTVCYFSEHGAYEGIRESKPDLVILDLRMEHPESGVNVLELMKLDPATAAIPVILSSADGHFLRNNAQRLIDKGCDILEKPFHLDELLAKVERAIGPPPEREAEA
jgi:two-component system, NtrC family, nitrogen regulation response regulator NtrX